jgi:tripartite-type tricarboxylate transporter receptor subunit TctC
MAIRRTVLSSIAACAAAAALSPAFAANAAADYPNRPIRLIVPFGAGGSTDMVARLLADKMGQILGKAVVVDNRGGAGGSIGASEIAKAAPDGYTIGMATVSTHGSNPAIFRKLPYDAIKDFAPITNVMSVPSVFVVNASVPAKTMKEFIALAKANPDKYTFASPGTGSLGHANIENFMNLAGIQLLHIPYKGAGQAITDALGGQVNAMTDNLPSTLPHIKAGQLRPLAVLALKRSDVLPDVPTYTELGYPRWATAAGSAWWRLRAHPSPSSTSSMLRPTRSWLRPTIWKSRSPSPASPWATRPSSLPSRSRPRSSATRPWPSAPISSWTDEGFNVCA